MGSSSLDTSVFLGQRRCEPGPGKASSGHLLALFVHFMILQLQTLYFSRGLSQDQVEPITAINGKQLEAARMSLDDRFIFDNIKVKK